MAIFARIGLDNIIEEVVAVDNINCMTPGGIEREDIGVNFLIETTGHRTWKKGSMWTSGGVHKEGRTPFRANCPHVGWYYNSIHDIFHPPSPHNSWTLNTTTGHWEPPIERPQETDQEYLDGKEYVWNEDAYQADNTTGWELITSDE